MNSSAFGSVFIIFCPDFTMTVFILLFSFVFSICRAQIFTFQDVPIDQGSRMNLFYTYYVFSPEDTPEVDIKHPNVFLKFHDLQLVPRSDVKATELSPGQHSGFRLIVMRQSQFWHSFGTQNFCCQENDIGNLFVFSVLFFEETFFFFSVLIGHVSNCNSVTDMRYIKPQNSKAPDGSPWQMFERSVFPEKMNDGIDGTFTLDYTGVYMLVGISCGPLAGYTLKGSVAVRNSYGFLPAIDFPKMGFYNNLAVFYIILAVGWAVQVARNWENLFKIHNCITGVVLFSLLECLLWYGYFDNWNSDGLQSKPLFYLAIIFTVLKSIFSYMLLFVASLGWGVTRPYLDSKLVMKVKVLSFVYILCDLCRQFVFADRRAKAVSAFWSTVSLLPVTFLNLVIFYWIFHSLSTLIETLKERKQTDKLRLFTVLWRTLGFTLAIAAVTLLLHMYMTFFDVPMRWTHSWYFSDGIQHILFALVLAVIMWLWRPHERSSSLHSYSMDIRNHVPDHPESPNPASPGHNSNEWDAVEDLSDDEDVGFWGATKLSIDKDELDSTEDVDDDVILEMARQLEQDSQPQPQTLGASLDDK